MATQSFWKPLTVAAALGLGWTAAATAQEPQVVGTIPYHQRHAVFKPALNIPTRRPQQEVGYEFPTKPVFLKGYSGYLYGKGPREAFIPTGYGVGTIEPIGITEPRRVGPRFWGLWKQY